MWYAFGHRFNVQRNNFYNIRSLGIIYQSDKPTRNITISFQNPKLHNYHTHAQAILTSTVLSTVSARDVTGSSYV